jgi:hypothetical protein
MPETLTRSAPRWILTGSLLLAAVAATPGAGVAQGYPPQQPAPQGTAANPMCTRLEAQLAMIDRGGADPARADQIRRYEGAAARQQQELDRLTAQAQRMGCDSSGFFSLFNGRSAQCGPVNNQIQQMRANLDQITANLEQLRGGAGNHERDSQRRSVLLALAQNNCGPQYANAARNSGGFLENLFGGGNDTQVIAPPPPSVAAPSGTYRTVCVRSCDGYYFPISFATVPSRFADDERTCKNQCPASPAELYTYRNPGEDMHQAVSLSGQSYTALPTAFAYRKTFNPSCSCKPAGETWAQALKNLDDKSSLHQGDIIVTDERAKRMSQPPKAPALKKSIDTPKASSSSAPADKPAAQQPADAAGDKHIRHVGPKFLQNQ